MQSKKNTEQLSIFSDEAAQAVTGSKPLSADSRPAGQTGARAQRGGGGRSGKGGGGGGDGGGGTTRGLIVAMAVGVAVGVLVTVRIVTLAVVRRTVVTVASHVSLPHFQYQHSVYHGHLERALVVAHARRGHVFSTVPVKADFVARAHHRIGLDPPTRQKTSGVVTPIVERPVHDCPASLA